MKSVSAVFLVGSLFAVSANAQAAQVFELGDFNVSPLHLQGPGNANAGTLTVDEAASELRLEVTTDYSCAGPICPAVMPGHLQVTLPIVEINAIGCGSREVIARVDARPVDGMLQVITFVDHSQRVCLDLPGPSSASYYTQSPYSSAGGLTSTMTAKPSLKVKHFQIDEFLMDPKHIPSVGRPDGGSLEVNFAQSHLSLVINFAYYCAPGLVCIELFPAPLSVELDDVKVKDLGCGSVEYTATRDLRPVDGPLQTLTVTDHTARVCDDFIEKALVVKYHSAGYNFIEGTDWSAMSTFYGHL